MIKVSDKLSNLVTDPEHVREHTFHQANIFFIITSICGDHDMNSTLYLQPTTNIQLLVMNNTDIYHCKHSISTTFLLESLQSHSNITAILLHVKIIQLMQANISKQQQAMIQ